MTNMDLEAMLNSLFDIVHVTDAEGRTIFRPPFKTESCLS